MIQIVEMEVSSDGALTFLHFPRVVQTSIVGARRLGVFLVSSLNYKAYHIPLKNRHPIDKSDHIRPTSLG